MNQGFTFAYICGFSNLSYRVPFFTLTPSDLASSDLPIVV